MNRIFQRMVWCGFIFSACVVISAVMVMTPLAAADGISVPSVDTEPVPPTRLRTLDDHFPFTPPESVEEWETRREAIRRQILVSLGLWPMPERAPMQPVIHGRVERDDFTVERVFFESYPGHFVTGSLFRPKSVEGETLDSATVVKRPGILAPHGHWADGRFYAAGAKETQWDIANGAERFEDEGRYPLQSRCVQLARMGCVVFHYDMVGYADSVQLGHRLELRPEMATPDRWGLFSPQAELRSINEMGIQTFNSIAALDFLESLPDVDPSRIGVSGASGGGTQTFILCAIDPRPAVAFPAVMVGTSMQGGCVCENACYLRNRFGNVEIAACFAPKPLGMTAADDWTREMPTDGFPQLQTLYSMYGAKDRVGLFPFLHFGHNYNQPSRAAMYRWMSRFLGLGFDEPVLERPYMPLSQAELTVWTGPGGAHPRPSGDLVGDAYELELMRRMDADNHRRIGALIPQEPEDGESANSADFDAQMAEYRRIVGGAFSAMVGGIPAPERVKWSLDSPSSLAGGNLPTVENPSLRPGGTVAKTDRWLSNRSGNGEGTVRRVIIAERHPIDEHSFNSMVDASSAEMEGTLWIHPSSAHRIPSEATGHPERARLVSDENANDSWSKSLAYTYGYNDPPVAEAARKILEVGVWARDLYPNAKIELRASPEMTPAMALAWAVDAAENGDDDDDSRHPLFDRAVFVTGGFRFADVRSFDDPRMLPGAVKFGDIPAMLRLGGHKPVEFIDE